MDSDSQALTTPRSSPVRLSEPTVRPHETLYFEDGDIVLMSLPKDAVITSFRVDKVFLSRHSPVFKDMFSFPSPDNVEKHDGVPLVHLQDEAEHLATFLNALYDPSTIPYEKHHSDTAKRVEGTLKLCTKYQIDGLRKRIISQLLQDWPNRLDFWDIAQNEISAKVNGEFVDDTGGWLIDHTFPKDDMLPEPCSVIHIARECNVPELLRAAFYNLSRIPPFADFDLEDKGDEDYWGYVNGGGRRGRFTLLSRDDLMCVLQGSRAMAIFVQRVLLTTLERTKRRCPSRSTGRCEKLLGRYSKELESDFFHDMDPLEKLRVNDLPTTICSSCRMTFRGALLTARTELWDRLPGFFGFEAD